MSLNNLDFTTRQIRFLTNLRIPFKTNGGTDLVATLITKDAFTPSANSTQIYIKLLVTRNS